MNCKSSAWNFISAHRLQDFQWVFLCNPTNIRRKSDRYKRKNFRSVNFFAIYGSSRRRKSNVKYRAEGQHIRYITSTEFVTRASMVSKPKLPGTQADIHHTHIQTWFRSNVVLQSRFPEVYKNLRFHIFLVPHGRLCIKLACGIFFHKVPIINAWDGKLA